MIHPFEEQGLGLAPFKFVDLIERVIVYPGGRSQPSGICNYCGKGIKYCCVIQGSDSSRFEVGTDCVKKIGREDNKMLSDCEREMAKIEKAKREQKRIDKFNEKQRKINEELDRQRSANCGLTDSEVADKKRKEELEAKKAHFRNKNAEVIKILESQSGNFCESMAQELSVRDFSSLPERAMDIIAEIVTKHKTGLSKNSKKFEIAFIQTLASLMS